MIGHVLREGWQLARSRAAVGAALAAVLSVPLTLAGVSVAAWEWLRPLTVSGGEEAPVVVLLRPELDLAAQRRWAAALEERRPGWSATVVPPREVASRLASWFPYLERLVHETGAGAVPPLVEVVAPGGPGGLAGLEDQDDVVAVGPRGELRHRARRIAAGAVAILGGLTAVLATSAVLLATVWVHLELYRYADEVEIMRLVGADEMAVRGPFLVATAVPGAVAGILAAAVTWLALAGLSRAVATVGLPPLPPSPWTGAAQVAAGLLLPFTATVVVLARHAHADGRS